jgi:hypothetical protein
VYRGWGVLACLFSIAIVNLFVCVFLDNLRAPMIACTLL